MIKFSFLFTVVFVISSCSYNHTNGAYVNGPNSFNNTSPSGLPTGSGCYAKCVVAHENQLIKTPLLQYTGDDFEDPSVEVKSILVTKSSASWVKKKANKNCLSPNPEDCMVWCLIENSAQYFDYYTVIDTNANKQFVIQKIDEVILKETGLREWRKVICEKDITPLFYYDLQKELYDREYISEDEYVADPDFTPAIKTALVQFQKDNDMAQGQLDLDTLDALGVDY